MMTPEQKRIAIAVACEWKWFPSRHNKEQKILARTQEEADSLPLGRYVWSLTPDYLNDRNAMHKAFLGLDESEKVECLGYLYEEARSNHHDKNVALAMATLPQWSNAFLLTIGQTP
jgi:hypothetical protein